MKHVSQKSGFTLVELLVVITIISLLAAFGFTKLMGARVEANKLASKEKLGQIHAHLLRYEMKKERLPSATGSDFVLSIWGLPYVERSRNNSSILFCPSLPLPELTDEELEEKDGITGGIIHWAGPLKKLGTSTARGASKRVILANKPLVEDEMPHQGECLCVLYLSGQTGEIDREAWGEDWGEDDILTIGDASPVEALQKITGHPDDDDY